MPQKCGRNAESAAGTDKDVANPEYQWQKSVHHDLIQEAENMAVSAKTPEQQV